MRILVLEFFNGGGLRERTDGTELAREGAAMLEMLLADLAALPRCRPVVALDARARIRTPTGVETCFVEDSPDRSLPALLRDCDAVWLIAPETRGCLAGLVEMAEAAGVEVIGSGSEAIRRSSDKIALASALARSGVPCVHTVPARAGERLNAPGFPLVVKPARGAGCEGVGLARTRSELTQALDAARRVEDDVLLQPLLSGTHASVALLADGRDAAPLATSLQRVRAGTRFRYLGGETPLDHPLAERARRHAAAACRAIPGLRGWVGVDLVLTDRDAVVIEINPRLTTSCLGVRAALGINLADRVIRACRGTLDPVPPPRARVRFDASGEVRAEVPAPV